MAAKQKRLIRKIHDLGRYNKRILIQHQALSKDGTFGTDPIWTGPPLKEAWARYEGRGDSQRGDNQYGRTGGKMDYFQYVNFYIQYDDSVFTIPKQNLRIIYPATEGNRAIFEIDGMIKTEGESFEIKFTCRGSERGLN